MEWSRSYEIDGNVSSFLVVIAKIFPLLLSLYLSSIYNIYN